MSVPTPTIVSTSTVADTSSNQQKFIDQYWPKVLEMKSLSVTNEKKLHEYQRAQWFCNYSGKSVPALQEFNAVKDNKLLTARFTTVDVDSNDEKKTKRLKKDISGPFDKLLQNQKYVSEYRVHECGHCFFDIALLCGVYDYLNFPYLDPIKANSGGEAEIEKFVIGKLKHLLTKCGICGDYPKKSSDRYYDELTSLDLGTIIRSHNVTPIKHLGAISTTLRIGDVVDTRGYRGHGLYIYEGILEGQPTFLEVPCGEYYPIWPVYYCQLQGYQYYLNKLNGQWDAIVLPNGYSFMQQYNRDGKFELQFFRSSETLECVGASNYRNPVAYPNPEDQNKKSDREHELKGKRKPIPQKSILGLLPVSEWPAKDKPVTVRVSQFETLTIDLSGPKHTFHFHH